MKIAVLGTGNVGRTLAGRLAEVGHDVVVGTRDPVATLARTEPDGMGTPPFAQWQAGHPAVRLVPFADAGAHGEVVVNATAGGGSLAALEAVGAASLDGKVLLDVGVPLDFSHGFPPSLLVKDTDSLAEQIQRAAPEARVVKSLNTMNCAVMVDPSRVPGPHDVFLAGDDPAAKEVVKGLLRELGWADEVIRDVGDLSAARGLEMFVALWVRLYASLGTADFNIHVAVAAEASGASKASGASNG